VRPIFSTRAWRALAPPVTALAMPAGHGALTAKVDWPGSEGTRRSVGALSFSILLDYPLHPEH